MSNIRNFTYVFTDSNGQTDTVVLETSKVAMNGTGFGAGYSVYAVAGSLGTTLITGEVGYGDAQQSNARTAFDNTVFKTDAHGDRGSFHGIDAEGVEFSAANGQRYDLFTLNDQFYLYDLATRSSVALTLEASNAPCYLGGTLIATQGGEAAVETLVIGDVVRTASGALRPLKWIGRRSYGGRFLASNQQVQPVRFAAGSLGEGLPRRPLLVSPDHAMLLAGVLVPARCLMNGTTITQERGLDRVDYYHVELDSHDVLLAEGAPSESFMDDGSRALFHNAQEHAALYPDAPEPAGFCAERVEGGPIVEAIRRSLAARAAA